jgi:NADH-quinone oxidoreductase subunit F
VWSCGAAGKPGPGGRTRRPTSPRTQSTQDDSERLRMGLLDQSASSLDEYSAAGGGEGLRRAMSMSPAQVIEEVRASGLRGRGGGGFPTGEKWDAIRRYGTGIRYVVCNGAEGEPATFKDRALLRSNPYRILEGISIAAYAVGAERAFLGLKETFAVEAEAARRAKEEMQEAGLITVPVELVLGPDHYLLGEETGLLETIEERLPLPRMARPYVLGLYAQPPNENPTLVNNVETLANVPLILEHGSGWLRNTGTDASPGTMLFTVAGDVNREGVFEYPLGTPLRQLLEEAAGGPPEGRSIKVVFPGSSNTVMIPEQLDTPVDFESMRAIGSGLGAGGFAVYDDSTCIVEVGRLFCRFLHVESCAQCPPCKLNSGDILQVFERLDRGEDPVGLDVAFERATTVTDGQKCALPTGTSLLMQSLLLTFADEIAGHRGNACTSRRGLILPKLLDLDQDSDRFIYDERYASKQPDWTYSATTTGP